MLLADAGISVWIVALFVIGIFGFIVSVLTILFRALGRFVRMIFGVRPTPPPPPPRLPYNTICPHAGCGHVNQPRALYCARCGHPLRTRPDIDAHG